MSVRTYDGGARSDGSPRGERIAILLGGEEFVLSVDGATRLRDDLTRELGEPAPRHLTPAEREAWAQAYEARRKTGAPFVEAYAVASGVVAGLREAAPVALSDREAMVWAAEYVRCLANDVHVTVAARSAHQVVTELRRWSGYTSLPDDVSAMLSAMTGGAR